MEINFICAHTHKVLTQNFEDNEKITLPSGWVAPAMGLLSETPTPVPVNSKNIIAFSSQKACDKYKQALLFGKDNSNS